MRPNGNRRRPARISMGQAAWRLIFGYKPARGSRANARPVGRPVARVPARPASRPAVRPAPSYLQRTAARPATYRPAAKPAMPRPRTRKPERARRPLPLPRITPGRLLAVLWTAFAVLAYRALTASPFLMVRKVEVRGLQGTLPDEAAQVSGAAAVPPRTNLLRYKPNALAQSLAALPWVERVSVGKHLPGSLLVQITPRRAVAVVQVAGGSWEVDASGHVIRPARADLKAPIIALASGDGLSSGQVIQDTGMLELFSAMAPGGPAAGLPVAKISLDPSAELCLNMADSISVELGTADRLSDKFAKLQSIYRSDSNIGAELATIDLRCPEAPACIPRVAAKAVPQDAAGHSAPNRSQFD